jgi:hypothetical protein
MDGSVAEHAVPLVTATAEVLALGLLVAARDAPGVALGGMHPPATLLQRRHAHSRLVYPGIGSALRLPSLRGHRSSNRSKLGFSHAYHLTTG